MSRRHVAEAVKRRLDAGFRYVPDTEQWGRLEHWRSAANDVRAGAAWADDCDGYACTAAELAVEDHGLPAADVALATCTTETGAGHLVCLVFGPGETWVIDNRQRAVWPWSDLPYTWRSAMRLNERGTWRAVRGAP